jgi:hypothetical protein
MGEGPGSRGRRRILRTAPGPNRASENKISQVCATSGRAVQEATFVGLWRRVARGLLLTGVPEVGKG